MKPMAEVDAERRAAILAGAALIPKGSCHYCGWDVPKPALWCASACAHDFHAEKAELLKS